METSVPHLEGLLPAKYVTAELGKKWQVSLGRMSKSQEAQNSTVLPEERN